MYFSSIPIPILMTESFFFAKLTTITKHSLWI